jgi:Rps23 Pro-64 3,4-dihydroxylase Tpa1-like proline 4-hydroxylase
MNKHDKLLSDCIYAFQAKEIMKMIEYITGINSLEPDPLLYAGGLSIMNKGDFLNPHIDNSHDRSKTKYRRLNLLYYVTPNWKESMGGNLELWDKDMEKSIKIESTQNRLVVMETNKTSFHSVNHISSENSRCCISNYFFTLSSPEKYQYEHVTEFYGRPNEYIKKILSSLDNTSRNLVSKFLKINRGKDLINTTKK